MDAENRFKETNSRRDFLTRLGAISVAGTVAGVATAGLNAEPPKLTSVAIPGPDADLTVTREESYDIPGGKECFLEWTARDKNGSWQKFLGHIARTDAPVSYTLTANVVIHTYASGSKATAEPVLTKKQNVTISAIKGDSDGAFRRDHMTITTIHADGSTSRVTQEVPVQLDTSQYLNMDAATIIASMRGLASSPHREGGR